MRQPISIVDTHVHVMAAADPAYPQDHLFENSWTTTHPLSVEGLIEMTAGLGVDQAALVQAPSAHAYDNRYVTDSARRFPERFVSVGIVDALAPGAADLLRRSVINDGMTALRLYAHYGGTDVFDPDDERTLPIWQAAAELGIVVTMQCGLGHVSRLRKTLERFPGVTVALDHLGGARPDGVTPFANAAAVLNLADLPNLNLKFETNAIDACKEANVPFDDYLGRFIQRFGAGRLMWGSNYPARHNRPYAEVVADALEAVSVFPDADQRLLLGGTARRIWPQLA